MKRLLILAMLILGLAGCAQDPCAYGDGLPSCDASRAVAKQTIAVSDATRAAVDAESAMKATQNAVALKVQATQGSINSQATAVAVQQSATRGAREQNAEGTKQAIGLEATRTTMMMSATQSALVLQATSQSITADATQTALEGETRIQRSAVDLAAAGWQQMIMVTVVTAAFVALVVGGLWYSRRAAQIGIHSLTVRTSTVRYGPNNSHWALVSPGKDGKMHVLLTDGMIGPYASSDGLLSSLQQLQLPASIILQVMTEQMKRGQMVLAAQTAGQLPGRVTERVELPAAPQIQQLPAPVTIVGSNLPKAPAFSELMASWRPSAQQMMLGVNAKGPIYGTIEDMLSIGVVGRPKTGKTTLLRFIYAQCLMVGAGVIVWDLHRNIVKDLPGANACTQLEQIEASAEQLMELMRIRIARENYAAKWLMVLVDEFPLLSKASAVVVEAIGKFVLEGRKVQIYVMVAGQGFPANLYGGSKVREAFSRRYVCPTSNKQAQMSGLDNESAVWVRNLPRGYAVLDGPVDPTIVAIPNTTREDVTALIATSGSGEEATSAASGTASDDGRRSGAADRREVAREVDDEVDDEVTERVREMVMARKSNRQIIGEIWGVSGGDAYTKASRELSEIVASIMSKQMAESV